MNAKHTKGPWVAAEGRHVPSDKDKRTFWVINGSNDDGDPPMPIRICDVRRSYEQCSPEADARLIAAAPDLLDVCAAIFSDVHRGIAMSNDRLLQLRKALDKSEGR